MAPTLEGGGSGSSEAMVEEEEEIVTEEEVDTMIDVVDGTDQGLDPDLVVDAGTDQGPDPDLEAVGGGHPVTDQGIGHGEVPGIGQGPPTSLGGPKEGMSLNLRPGELGGTTPSHRGHRRNENIDQDLEATLDKDSPTFLQLFCFFCWNFYMQ